MRGKANSIISLSIFKDLSQNSDRYLAVDIFKEFHLLPLLLSVTYPEFSGGVSDFCSLGPPIAHKMHRMG